MLRLDISEEKREQVLQFIEFGVVGNTEMFYVINFGLLMLFQGGILLPEINYLFA